MQQKAATQFVDVLEEQQLLSPDIIEEMRRQISDSKSRLTPELIAKLLVDNGHLTKFQATKLISGIKEPEDADEPLEEAAKDESELGFAEESELQAEDAGAPVAAVLLDDEDEEAPVDVVAEKPVAVVEVEAESATAVAVQAVPATVEVLSSEPKADSGDAFAASSTPKPSKPKKTTQLKKANPYDSFRILGVGLLLALTCIAGFFLVRWMLKGNADDQLARADKSYEQRSYEDASTLYTGFAENWPTNESASYARVRAALAALRKDAEGVPNPSVGLATALTVLPPITEEPALTEQRDDLTGALIGLAGKFNKRADDKKNTGERRELMDEMAKVMELINNPVYVGQAQRKRQEPTLEQIEESRDRILREINRDDSLKAALAKIDERLAAKDTMASYDIRSELLNEYPGLVTNEEVVNRVKSASKIQMELVANGDLNPRVSDSEPDSAIGKSYILGNKSGGTARSLEGQVIFAKVKGSVYGLEGGTGEILWRKFVGSEFKNDPIRIDQAGSVDALICQPELGLVSRVDGQTGETKWFANFGSPIHMPVVETNDLFVATYDGQVASMDLEGGQVMWSKKLPQNITVGPGVGFNKSQLYIPADHTNLYVLSRKDGSCKEVVYLGHRDGAITVSPTMHMGHLFIYDNYKSDKTKVRIFTFDDAGLNVTETQRPQILTGNVVIAPQIDRRRIAVLTDLGEISVLDVEPTVEKNKVTEVGNRGKIHYSPELAWLAAGDNALWVVDRRLTRIDVRVSIGDLESTWTKHDGDYFAGRPQFYDDTIVHSRTLRGNQGVRVAAVDADTGDPFWETDLGVPVTGIVKSGSNYNAFNTAGMLFTLDANDKRSSANANAGQGKILMNFGSPIQLGEQLVLLNRSKSNQIALFTPPRKLQKLIATFGTGTPTFKPIAVEDKLLVGLDIGQVILLDPTTGAVTAPYQPPMKAAQKVTWNRPVYLPDSNTIVISSSLQKLVRLGAGDSLRALSEVDLASPLISPIANVGDALTAVISGSGGDKLQYFDAQSLQPSTQLELQGSWIAGPYVVGEMGFVQTSEELVAFDAAGQALWKMPLPNSPLVGEPLPHETELIFATQSGQVFSVNANTGDLVGKSDAGQGLTSKPIVLRDVLLFGSDEGVVLALKFPEGVAEVQ